MTFASKSALDHTFIALVSWFFLLVSAELLYVLRSQSSHPFVAEYRELIHKMGVTGGKVETAHRGSA